MIYFDSSFLADYLQKEEYTRDFLQDNENESFHTTSIVRYELLVVRSTRVKCWHYLLLPRSDFYAAA
jgi:predicted nucleic acid-binding protein